MISRTRALQLAMMLLPWAGLACDGRAVSLGDGGRAEDQGSHANGHELGTIAADTASGPLPHCAGQDKLFLDGKPLPNDHVEAWVMAQTKQPGDSLRVTLSLGQMSADPSWSGVFVHFTTPATMKPVSAPLQLDLSALPSGWRVDASKFAGSCGGAKSGCSSAASPVGGKGPILYQGLLQVTAGSTPRVTLCLSATMAPGAAPFLEFYARDVAIVRY